MAKLERLINIPMYLQSISGIKSITQKPSNHVTTVYYTDGTKESAIYPHNILDSIDSDTQADIVEFIRKANGHKINSYLKI